MPIAGWLALTLLAGAPAPAPAGPHVIEDDYARALQTAKASKRLLFVDAWAPWCHTCVFMREHVLTRAAFKAFEADVVFAAVDTEKPGSAAFLAKFPVEVWPTLFFIEPSTERVVLTWLGSADEAQMAALLGAVRQAGASGKGVAADPSSGWGTLALLSGLFMRGEYATCAKTAHDAAARLSAPGDVANAAVWGLGCALEAPDGPLRAALVDDAQKAVHLEGLLADDRSGVYEVLVQAAQAAGDEARARTLAHEWLAFLEKEAAAAATPAARAVFDPHRTEAALAAGVPERVVDALARSERDLPRDYNPPARLALVYRALGRLGDALAANARALTRCQGPRRLRLLETQASLLDDAGRHAEAAKTRDAMLAYARRLPRAQLSQKRLDALEARVAAAKKAPGP